MNTPHLKDAMRLFCDGIGHDITDGLHRARRLHEAGVLPKTTRGRAPPEATPHDCAVFFLGLISSPIAMDAPAAAVSRGGLVLSHYEAVTVDAETGRETRQKMRRKPKQRGIHLVDRLAGFIRAGTKPESRATVGAIVQSIRVYQGAPCAMIRCGLDKGLFAEEVYLPDSTSEHVLITENDMRAFLRGRAGAALSPAVEVEPDVLFLFSEILNGEHELAAEPTAVALTGASAEHRATA